MTKEEFKNLQIGTIVCTKYRGEVQEIFVWSEIFVNGMITIVEHENCYSVLCANQFTTEHLFIATHEDFENYKSILERKFKSRISRLNLLESGIKIYD